MTSWLSLTARGLIGFFCLASLTPVADAFQKEDEKKEGQTVYQANMVGIRGRVGARSIGINIRITGETSDEDVREYLELLAESGDSGLSGPLRRRLEKVTGLGRINADGFIGTELAVVRKRETEEGELITLVTARNLPMLELYRAPRSRDYPFSFVQLLVNEEGKGQGTVILAARARFDKEGRLEIESYGIQPFQLFNVRRR